VRQEKIKTFFIVLIVPKEIVLPLKNIIKKKTSKKHDTGFYSNCN
jgi:hypothetical protein